MGATASDNYDGDISGSIVIDSAAVNTAAVGSYSVTYDVADANGNTATTMTRTVNVVDTTAPVITLLGSNPQIIEIGSPYVELGATASDNYDGDISGLVVIDSSAVDTSVVGSYSVTYDVTDANGNAAATVTRTVDVINAAPTLGVLSNLTVAEGSPVAFTATASDPDPLDSLLFSLSGAPSGAAIDPVSGDFSWVPSESQGPGSFTFDVVVTDSGSPALTGTASITITVTEVNLAPSLTPIAPQSGAELTTITFDALAGDPDLPSNTLAFILSGAPAGASIDPATGAFTWTPTEAQGPGVYTFDITVTDDGSPSFGDTITVSVTVTEVNAAPTVTNPGGQFVAETDAVSLFVGAADPDNPANGLTFAASGLPDGLSIDPVTGEISGTVAYTANASSPFITTVTVTDDGSPNRSGSTTFTWTVSDTNRSPIAAGDTVTVVEDGSGTWDVVANDSDPDGDPLALTGVGVPGNGTAGIVAGQAMYAPDPDFSGTDSFTYSVSDGRGGFDTGTITVTVTAVNDAPIMTGPTALTVTELNLAAFTVTTTDVEDDAITYGLLGAPTGAAIDAAGRFTWTPTEAQGPGTFSFHVVATDSGLPARSDTHGVAITVVELNAAPTITSPGTQTTAEDDWASLAIVASDPDIPGDTLHFSATGLPPGLGINTATGVISGAIPFDAAAGSPYTVTVTVADDGTPQRTASTTFLWNVAETNHPPVVEEIRIAAEAGIPVTILLAATDPDGDSLSYRVTEPPTQGTVAGGPQVLIYTPTPAASGVDTLTFAVSDGDLITSGIVTIDITPNLVPTGGTDEFVTRRGGTLVVDVPGVMANDRDPEGEPIAVAVNTNPQHGSLLLNSDGSFEYIHDGDDADLDTFTYRIDDGMRRSGPISVRIIIEENEAPTAVGDVFSLDEDVSLTFSVLDNDSDPNNEPVTVVAAADPEHGTIDWAAGGQVTYTPDANWNGVDSFEYRISDGDLDATGLVTLVVNSVNDVPGIVDLTATGASGEVLVIDLNPYAVDIDGDSLTFRMEAPPHGHLEQTAPGVFAISLDGVIEDLPPLAIIVTDTHGAHASSLMRITVKIPAELIGVPSLVADDVSLAQSGGGAFDGLTAEERTSLVAGLRLMIGSVLSTFMALRMPSLLLAVIVVASLYLGLSRRFAFSSSATALPLGGKKRVDIVMAQSRAGVPARDEAGAHQTIIHRFGPDETGIVTTGARSMVRSEVWLEVETVGEDAWVNAEFVTEQVPHGTFLEDERPAQMIADMVDSIYESGDLLPITAGHDLHVAVFGPPVRFAASSLRRLLTGGSVYWWWGAEGDAPNTQASFAEMVGESVTAAYRNRGAHYRDPLFAIPIEFANMHSLVIGNQEYREGWRIFFRYEDDTPSIAGIMREADFNPAAMHGMMLREDVVD